MNRRGTKISQAELGQVERRRHVDRVPGRRRSGITVLVGLLLLAAFFGGGLGAWLHSQRGASISDSRRPATSAVVFIVDGLQPTDIDATLMPHLLALTRQGSDYRSAWIGQLEADPLSSSASIGTGVFPRKHGVVGPEWYNPTSQLVVKPGSVQQAVLGNLDQIMELHKVTPVAAVLKAAIPNSRVLAVGGSSCAEPNAVGTWLADYVLCFARDGRNWVPTAVAGHGMPSSFHLPASLTVASAAGKGVAPAVEGWTLGNQDASISRYAALAITAVHPTLTYVDFPEYGELMPYAPLSQEQRIRQTLLRGIDRAIASIVFQVRHLRGPSRPVFVVTSGESIAGADRAVSRSPISDAVITAGAEQTYVAGSGLAAVGLLDPLQGAPVAQNLEGQHLAAVDSIFYKSRVHKGWKYDLQYLNPLLPSSVADADTYLASTLACLEGPEVLMAYAPGAGHASPARGSFVSLTVSGGVQWDTQHVALVFFGQGIVPGRSLRSPARLVDIAPTVETALAVHPGPGDGVVLADALLYPTQDELDAQATSDAQLDPLVRALKNRLTE